MMNETDKLKDEFKALACQLSKHNAAEGAKYFQEGFARKTCKKELAVVAQRLQSLGVDVLELYNNGPKKGSSYLFCTKDLQLENN